MVIGGVVGPKLTDNLNMDESSLPQSHREDRISDLPDSLIHMILSFIDMKYAVQTSVLSKRWQYIWRSLSTLNFGVDGFGWGRTVTFTKFANFVYKVLLFRDYCRIQRFQLNVRQDSIDSSHIDTWITKAVKHNVEELCIKGDISDKLCIFSHSLCTCKSLTNLELELPHRFNFGWEIISTSVILPKLKSMNLQLPNLSPDDEMLASVLFTKCPALESLVLDFRGYPPTNLNISVPKLKRFSLTTGAYAGPGSKVTLCAPNLSSFICFSNLLHDYCLEGFSSHVTADVRINIEGYNESKIELCEAEKLSYARRLVKLMRGIHNVKVLSLTNDFKVLAGAPEIVDSRILNFPNLQRLILKTWLSRGCIDAIIYLLKKSPNIEFLELNIEPGMVLDGKEFWDSAISLPFMLHHLKYIVLRGVRGYRIEAQFIEIMLKNAMALEKVVLFGKFSEQDSRRRRRNKKFKGTLFALPGASSIISFRVVSK